MRIGLVGATGRLGGLITQVLTDAEAVVTAVEAHPGRCGNTTRCMGSWRWMSPSPADGSARTERTGEQVSFTAFLVACLARAVDEHPTVAAFRSGKRLVVFDHVDVAHRSPRAQVHVLHDADHLSMVNDAEHAAELTAIILDQLAALDRP